MQIIKITEDTMENNIQFKRARTPLQFELRAQQIIDACAHIFETEGYENVNFANISKLSNITRPLIYKYFESNEEILVEVLKREVHSFTANISESFAKKDTNISLEEFSQVWTDCLFKSPSFLRLYNLLFSSLETKLSFEKILSYKQHSLLASKSAVVEILTRFFPNANSKQLMEFVVIQLALATGITPMIHLSSKQLRASKETFSDYKQPNVEIFRKGLVPVLFALKNGQL